MRGHQEEHVLEVVKRRNIDQLAALDEGIQECGPTGPFEVAREQPILATRRDGAELALGAAIVDRVPFQGSSD